MIVVRLYGQFHLSGMVCYHPAAVIPADFIDGFAEGVEGKWKIHSYLPPSVHFKVIP